jgi:hypothetical protein
VVTDVGEECASQIFIGATFGFPPLCLSRFS